MRHHYYLNRRQKLAMIEHQLGSRFEESGTILEASLQVKKREKLKYYSIIIKVYYCFKNLRNLRKNKRVYKSKLIGVD